MIASFLSLIMLFLPLDRVDAALGGCLVTCTSFYLDYLLLYEFPDLYEPLKLLGIATDTELMPPYALSMEVAC